jgi:arginase family enzyme
MNTRVVDLDGSIVVQSTLLERHTPALADLRAWGPRLRLGCRWGVFERFAETLDRALEVGGHKPHITFCGSGDFHHVSLALLRRLKQPANLLVIDNHPDWMRGVPILHCGTWLYHAARLPHVKHVFHVGGDVDFDNHYRWLAPWRMLEEGKIAVFPGVRRFRRGPWRRIAHESVRPRRDTTATPCRIAGLVETYSSELRQHPLYISLDKDVMRPHEAPSNWDSGHLTLPEVEQILAAFLAASGNRLVGMDIVGDWSPVETRGILRRVLHWTEHPPLSIDPVDASQRNEITNLSLLETLSGQLDQAMKADRGTVAVAALTA